MVEYVCALILISIHYLSMVTHKFIRYNSANKKEVFYVFQALIHTYADDLTDNDYYILDYIERHPNDTQKMTIVALSDACMTSKSTILRLTQKLGFSGYSEFKYFLKEHALKEDHPSDLFELSRYDIDYTIQLFEEIDKRAIYELIDQAQSLYGFATGFGQENALRELKRYFFASGKHLYHLPALTEFQMALKEITTDDLVILISLSGDVHPILNHLKRLKAKGIPTLSITSFKNNHLAEHSTYHLYYQSTDLGTYNDHTQKSFIGLQVLIDLLFRGFLDYKKNS